MFLGGGWNKERWYAVYNKAKSDECGSCYCCPRVRQYWIHNSPRFGTIEKASGRQVGSGRDQTPFIARFFYRSEKKGRKSLHRFEQSHMVRLLYRLSRNKVSPISFGIALWLLVINPFFGCSRFAWQVSSLSCWGRRCLTFHFIPLSSWSLYYAQLRALFSFRGLT